MLDAAVLAGAVASLQHHQHTVQLGAEHRILQLEHLFAELGKALLSRLAREALGRIGRQLAEPHLGARFVE